MISVVVNTRDGYAGYSGIEDCNMLSFVPDSGPKICSYGCVEGRFIHALKQMHGECVK